jgi:hypothetical protein
MAWQPDRNRAGELCRLMARRREEPPDAFFRKALMGSVVDQNISFSNRFCTFFLNFDI